MGSAVSWLYWVIRVFAFICLPFAYEGKLSSTLVKAKLGITINFSTLCGVTLLIGRILWMEKSLYTNAFEMTKYRIQCRGVSWIIRVSFVFCIRILIYAQYTTWNLSFAVQCQKPAYAVSTQSDQRLRFSVPRQYNTYIPEYFIQTVTTLASFRSWAGRVESYLVGHLPVPIFLIVQKLQVQRFKVIIRVNIIISSWYPTIFSVKPSNKDAQ